MSSSALANGNQEHFKRHSNHFTTICCVFCACSLTLKHTTSSGDQDNFGLPRKQENLTSNGRLPHPLHFKLVVNPRSAKRTFFLSNETSSIKKNAPIHQWILNNTTSRE